MPRPKRKESYAENRTISVFARTVFLRRRLSFLTVDEFETIRLVDLEKQTHEETARGRCRFRGLL